MPILMIVATAGNNIRAMKRRFTNETYTVDYRHVWYNGME